MLIGLVKSLIFANKKSLSSATTNNLLLILALILGLSYSVKNYHQKMLYLFDFLDLIFDQSHLLLLDTTYYFVQQVHSQQLQQSHIFEL